MNRRVLTHGEAIDFFSTIYGGLHHIPGPRNATPEECVKPWGSGSWLVNHHGELSSYDWDTLTRLVLLGHERCIRVSVLHGGPRSVRVGISARSRVPSIMEGHPTIEEAVAKFRERLGG